MKKPQIVEWRREFETGVAEVDQQHKKLFALLNRLIEVRKSLVPRDELEQILEELLDYTQYHFSTEELLFKEHPIYRKHKREHIKFTIAIMKYNILFLEGKQHLDSNILFFLINWLKNHILKVDMETFAQLNKSIRR